MNWENYPWRGFVWDARLVGSLAMLLREAVMGRHCRYGIKVFECA